jgi:hypothetical protein
MMICWTWMIYKKSHLRKTRNSLQSNLRKIGSNRRMTLSSSMTTWMILPRKVQKPKINLRIRIILRRTRKNRPIIMGLKMMMTMLKPFLWKTPSFLVETRSINKDWMTTMKISLMMMMMNLNRVQTLRSRSRRSR